MHRRILSALAIDRLAHPVALVLMVAACAPGDGVLPASRHQGVRQIATCLARFDRAPPDTTPFPSDLFVVPDDAQITGVRVDLPEGNCSASPRECSEVEV